MSRSFPSAFLLRLRPAGALARIAPAVVLLISAGCGALIGVRPLSAARPGLTTYHTIEIAGRSRSFLLHLPPAAAAGVPLPLVLMFHGYQGNGATLMAESRMNDAADRAGYAVAYPDGSGRFKYAWLSWNAVSCCGVVAERHVDDIGFADAIVRRLVSAGRVNPDRVYAAGFSAGGMIALRLACTRARAYAAVADVAGAMPDTACVPARAVPTILFQGEDDSDLRDDQSVHKHHKAFPWSTSLEKALDFWARVGKCAPGPLRDTTSAYIRQRARECPDGMDVTLITVHHHPHAWPGGESAFPFGSQPAPEPDASAMILDFFSRHALVAAER